MVRDRDHLDQLLAGLADAGVDDLFLIGGDIEDPVGEYASAVDLLPLVVDCAQRPGMIGIAGYPEGHPRISVEDLDQALRDKSRLADYVVTQMCFDPEALRTWIVRQREHGMELPVVIGMPGRVARRKLLKMSARIGVGPSIDFLRKQKGLRSLLSRRSTADRLYDGIAPMLDDPELAVDGIQYFTFNELLQTWEWHQKKLASNPKGSTGVPPVAARWGTREFRHRRVGHDTEQPARAAGRLRQHRRAAAQLADRRLRLPGRALRVQQLAPRAARLARDRRPVRPVAPHGQPLPARPRGAQADLRDGDQQRGGLPGRQGQAVRAHLAVRPRDRRRDPVPPRRGGVRVGRPGARRELALLPSGERWLRRRGREGRPLAVAPLRQAGDPQVLALPDPGPERLAGHREGQRRPGRAAEVLPHGAHERRGSPGADAAPRDGGRARPGAVRTLRDLRRDPRGDPRGRPRVRTRALRRARLRVEHARVRLDPVTAAGHLHRRRAARLPGVAARRGLRGHQRAGRQLRLRATSRTTTSTRGSWATASS